MMTGKMMIGTLRRPLTKILQDLVQPVPSEMLKQKPIYKRGRKTGEVSYVPWYKCIKLLMRYRALRAEVRSQKSEISSPKLV